MGHDFDTCARINEDENVQVPVQKIINMYVVHTSTYIGSMYLHAYYQAINSNVHVIARVSGLVSATT